MIEGKIIMSQKTETMVQILDSYIILINTDQKQGPNAAVVAMR